MSKPFPLVLRFAAGLLAVGALVAVTAGWARWEYGDHPPLPHRRVTISLPYAAEHEVRNLIPMGETIEHPIKNGHPGLDFQWGEPVPLIAVADGKIGKVSTAKDKDEKSVWYVTLNLGSYNATYKELETIEPGIKQGARIRQGEVIGYPHCTTQEGRTGCQLHWEFAYASFLPALAGKPDRLCPLTYFDTASLARIEASWEKVAPTDRFKKDFPFICSNAYHGYDE